MSDINNTTPILEVNATTTTGGGRKPTLPAKFSKFIEFSYYLIKQISKSDDIEIDENKLFTIARVFHDINDQTEFVNQFLTNNKTIVKEMKQQKKDMEKADKLNDKKVRKMLEKQNAPAKPRQRKTTANKTSENTLINELVQLANNTNPVVEVSVPVPVPVVEVSVPVPVPVVEVSVPVPVPVVEVSIPVSKPVENELIVDEYINTSQPPPVSTDVNKDKETKTKKTKEPKEKKTKEPKAKEPKETKTKETKAKEPKETKTKEPKEKKTKETKAKEPVVVEPVVVNTTNNDVGQEDDDEPELEVEQITIDGKEYFIDENNNLYNTVDYELIGVYNRETNIIQKP
jgi:glucan-binding YG repeat protein